MSDIFETANDYYFDYFPGLSVSDSTGILGEGLVRAGIAPLGTSDVVDSRIWSTSGLLDLARQDPLGASFLASQQELANQYLFGGGLEQDLVFPNQVNNLLQGGGDPTLSFGTNYLLSLGLEEWVQPSTYNVGAEAYSYAHYYPNGDVYFGIGYTTSGTFSPGQTFDGYSYADGSFGYGYEADITGVASYYADLYYFAYYYPNGDAYSGYGYAPTGTLTSGQTLTGYTHEDGYVGKLIHI